MQDVAVDPSVDQFFSKFDEEPSTSEPSSETKETDVSLEIDKKVEPEIDKSEDIKKESSKEDTEDKSTDDSETPFHKHPRFQEVIKQKNDLLDREKAWQKEKIELQKQIDELKHRPKTDEELEGMTASEIQKYTREQMERESKLQAEMDSLEKEKAERYIDEALQNIKDSGFEYDEQELLKLSEKYTEGNIEKAFELYQKFNETKQKGAEQEAREIAKKKAAQSNTSGRGSNSKKGFVRGTGWDSLDLA